MTGRACLVVCSDLLFLFFSFFVSLSVDSPWRFQNYDERYGYRSIIYGVEKRVVNVLASAHERDRIGAGCSVTLDLAEPTQPGQQPHVVLREITRRSDKEHAEGRKKLFGIF